MELIRFRGQYGEIAPRDPNQFGARDVRTRHRGRDDRQFSERNDVPSPLDAWGGIEKQWTNTADGLKTEVVEVPSGISMNAIVIKSGGETNVYPTGPRGTMNLMNIDPDDKNIAYGIAHESGHLFGIRDHYTKTMDATGRRMIENPVWPVTSTMLWARMGNLGYRQAISGRY
jgi:hypothetical protein